MDSHGFPWTAPRQRLQAPKTKRYISCTSQKFIQFNWAFPIFSAEIQREIQPENSFQRKFIQICTVFFQVVWSAGAAGAVRAIWTATRGWPGTQEIPGKLWETIWVLVETSQGKLMVWKDVWQENPCLKDFGTGNSGKRILAGENTWFTASFVLNIPTSLHPHCNWHNRNIQFPQSEKQLQDDDLQNKPVAI